MMADDCERDGMFWDKCFILWMATKYSLFFSLSIFKWLGHAGSMQDW